MSGEVVRRRSRQAVPRSKVVQFSLTQDEFDEVSSASQRLDLVARQPDLLHIGLESLPAAAGIA